MSCHNGVVVTLSQMPDLPMSIKFRCTCGKVYKVSEAHAGRKIFCKGCQKKLRVPGDKPAAPATPTAEGDDDFEFSDDLPERSPRGAGPPPLVRAERKQKQPAEESLRSSPDPSAGRKTAMIVGLALFGLLGIAGIGFVVVNAGNPGGTAEPEVPLQYVEFAAKQGHFKCEYPEKWEPKEGGGTGGFPPWVRFEDGTASISIKASQSGSAISDISGASQFPGGLDGRDDAETPLARVHDFQKSKNELSYSNYEEKPGDNIKILWGEVRISEFTGSEGFASKVQGYRVTLTGVQWQFNMICKCPPRKWEQYQPIFDHVIHSVGR